MPSSDFIPAPYDPCPCGSGKKFKFCCGGLTLRKPTIGKVAYYGPDPKTVTKIVASIADDKSNDILVTKKWLGEHVAVDPKVTSEVRQFFAEHKPRRIAISEWLAGCPHEEGVDFPVGTDCPHCPFWAGKQGTAARSTTKPTLE